MATYIANQSDTTGGGLEYIVYEDSSTWTAPKSTKENILGELTVNQKKMIKEEIKLWMDDHLKKELNKQAGQLVKDIEYLKEEKKRLGKAISALKHGMKKTKEEIQVEIKAMEKVMEDYNKKILRFYSMDL